MSESGTVPYLFEYNKEAGVPGAGLAEANVDMIVN